MEFSKEFKEKVKKGKIRMQLALKLDVSYYTITRWLDLKESDELTKPKYLKELSEISGISESEIFV